MCDTMGEIFQGGARFAKNSDRSANEPQVVEFYPAANHTDREVMTTYVAVEQVPHTYALILSRPVWLWGGEMGVNEHGVCIGNEAVFTKGKYSKTGLTGMDLLRLALERATTAAQAAEIIIGLLERYGQGGDCGYDHAFYYDNSFLILDRQSLYILETAGREWALKRQPRGSISNRLSMGADGDRYSAGKPIDFQKTYLEPLYSHFSGSARRLASTGACIHGNPNLNGLFAGLRQHDSRVHNPLTENSVSSPCMHAGGLVGDQTTGAMVVELARDITVWLTGSSTPCISLFKPFRFGNQPVAPLFVAGDDGAIAYWRTREDFHRAAIGHILPSEFYTERDALERNWIAASRDADAAAMDALSRQALIEETAFYAEWSPRLGTLPRAGRRRFLRYWQNKTARLDISERPVR